MNDLLYCYFFAYFDKENTVSGRLATILVVFFCKNAKNLKKVLLNCTVLLGPISVDSHLN